MSFDYFVDLGKKSSPETTDEFTAIYHCLIAKQTTSADGKDDQKSTSKKDADQIRNQWKTKHLHLSVRLSGQSGLVWNYITEPEIDFALLPDNSFFLSLIFTLATPYLSRDDNSFYIIDNPIVRDKVYRVPMVRPSSWKGNLYSALWQMGYERQNSLSMRRIFGQAHGQDNEEGFNQAGRLFLFPTFFQKTGLEIINPHDRSRRVGKNPILYESVPSNEKGCFSFLYIPFDHIGEDEQETCRQMVEDLRVLAEGLRAMFLTYGFSAKRSSGYGLAKTQVQDGTLQIKVEESVSLQSSATNPPNPAQNLPKCLIAPNKLKPEYLNPDGTFRERSQSELNSMTKPQRQDYEKAKKWWEREGKELSGREEVSNPPAQAATAERKWMTRKFSTFDELVERAKEIQEILIDAGEKNESNS
jgi:CRISPR-associated protein Cmr2